MASGRVTADILALFDRWLDLAEDERPAELERIRQRDESAWRGLQELIHADTELEHREFLRESAVSAAMRALAPTVPENPGGAGPAIVGPWTLLSSIGTGGMGRVWLASRNDGLYDGQVAIKMLHETAIDELAAERFRREGRILSRLAHLNIARLLDAGTLADGRCYLVLEYVRGERIDHYCNARRLDINARIRLFDQVCSAIGYAHANLVVHRDLKPANILVEEGGTVKLLDFGVAKFLNEQSGPTGDSPLTRLEGAGLTPEYAAPEQVDGGAITTATDVYSLGMVLYDLLCGRRPYGSESSSPVRLARDIVETSPRTASHSFAAPADATARVAAENLGGTPDRVRRQLRGDLDNILAKALRKAPEERYSSVAALQADLQAYLTDRPVQARPDKLGYRLRKFVQRNRSAVAGASLVALLLLSAVVVTLWQARVAIAERANAERQAGIARQQALIAEAESRRATEEAQRAAREEAKALAQQRQAERYRNNAQQEAVHARAEEAKALDQSRKARDEAEKAKAIKDFIVDIFRVNLPSSGDIDQARQLTAQQLLETGAQRIDVKFADRPDLRASLLDTVGELFFRLGDQERARKMTLERIALLDQLKDGDYKQHKLDSIRNLGYLARSAGNIAGQREALTLAAPLVPTGSLLTEGTELLEQARIESFNHPRAALALAEQSLRSFLRYDHVVPGNSSPRSGAYEVAARAQAQLGHYDLGIAAASEAQEAVARALPPRNYFAALAASMVGQAERAAGALVAAEATLRTALSHARRTMGATHPEALMIQSRLGAVLHAGVHRTEGMDLLVDAARRSAHSVGRNAIHDLRMRLELATAQFDEGLFDEAESTVANAIVELQDNADLRLILADASMLHARLHSVRGRHADAMAAVQQAAAIYADALGDRAPALGFALLLKAEILGREGRIGEARAYLEASERIPEGSGSRFPMLRIERELVDADLTLRRGLTGTAEGLFASVVSAIDDHAERDFHRSLLTRALLGLGRAAYMQKRLERARAVLERAIALRSESGNKSGPWLAEAQIALADVLIQTGDTAAARRLLDRAASGLAQAGPLDRAFTYPLEKVRQRLP